jgi:CspA family cold shock protein
VKGTIKKILPIRGFGFIKRDGEEKDLYFHWSKTLDDFYYLKAGDEVEFEIEKTDKGLQAIDVTTIF